MCKKTVTMVSLSLMLSAFTVFGKDNKGTEIAKKNFDLKDPETSYSNAVMDITDEKGKTKTRSLKMYSKKDENGTWSYIEFDSPADIKGTKLLSTPQKGEDAQQRIYLPALKKARLIASSGKGGKFVGSDFFYYDLKSREFEDNTYSFLREEKLNDRNCNVIEMTPKSGDSPYAKSEVWLSMDDNIAYQIKLYDKKGNKHIKTMSVLKTVTIDGCIIPTEINMENHKDNSSTKLTLSGTKVNQGVDENVFLVRNLEAR